MFQSVLVSQSLPFGLLSLVSLSFSVPRGLWRLDHQPLHIDWRRLNKTSVGMLTRLMVCTKQYCNLDPRLLSCPLVSERIRYFSRWFVPSNNRKGIRAGLTILFLFPKIGNVSIFLRGKGKSSNGILNTLREEVNFKHYHMTSGLKSGSPHKDGGSVYLPERISG